MRRAVLVGTARNLEKSLPKEIPKLIESLETEFELKVFIVESDSDDSTIMELSRLKELFPNSEYIIVADLDGVNSKLKSIDVTIAMKLNIDWDALMANQSAPYYDLYALRHDQLMPRNFLIDIENAVGRSSHLRKELIWKRMIRIDPNKEPILVKSAFGGLAIYKKWIFERFDYGDSKISNECEHVYLNLKACESGAKLFIVPSLINSGWNEHNLSKYFITRNLLRLKRRVSRYM